MVVAREGLGTADGKSSFSRASYQEGNTNVMGQK